MIIHLDAIPSLTVLMPVYNCELYIKEAIESILNQTYAEFEFLIIDDASTDGTVSIIESYTDFRIKLIEKPVNSGLIDSLNLGLRIAKGNYIARMDGDDISLPTRFAKQIRILEDNQDIAVCGSWFSIIGKDEVVKLPESNADIRLTFLRGNCMAHSSIMMRKYSLKGKPITYDVGMEAAEDYDLWVRLAFEGNLLYNIQEVLLQYRVHDSQVSMKQNSKQLKCVLAIKHSIYNRLDLNLIPEENKLLNKLMNDGIDIDFYDLSFLKQLQAKLLESNKSNIFESEGFINTIRDLEKLVVKRCFITKSEYSPKTYFDYIQVKRDLTYKLNYIEEIKLAIKSLIYFKQNRKK